MSGQPHAPRALLCDVFDLDERFVVILDDLKRFARDAESHIKLRREFDERGARVGCRSLKFEDTPEEYFIVTIIAAQGELEREQNRREVIRRMKARVENGYWVFCAPLGYRYVNAKGGSKMLVPDEPLASVFRKALEAYAYDRFASQADVRRFLEADPHFPGDLPDGRLRPMTVPSLLRKVANAGYVEAKAWDVSVRKAVHEPLVSFATQERIIGRLDGRKPPAARKDLNEDFSFRGFVLCIDCGKTMTACWSKRCRQHYPYYLCDTRGCRSKRKSIPRAKIEDSFATMLFRLQPTRQRFGAAERMFTDFWIALWMRAAPA